jgi:zinc protease
MRWTQDLHRVVLANGLTLLVQRDRSAPVVAVVTHVRAGYFDEPDEWVGIAHVLEHMYFKGTARRGPGAIARETQLLGGYINAGTIYDKTVYYTVLPAAGDGVERALDVQADALMDAALDEGELRRELEVIIQEAKRKLDSPRSVTTETLYELLFPTHRMRRWRIGTEAGLRRLTHADLRAYYLSRYTPAGTIVALVGDLDPERTMARAVETFGAWNRPAADIPGSPPERANRGTAFRRLSGDVERPLLSLGWRTVGSLHADTPALDLAATILGSGRGSRLYRALRVPGVAASAFAGHYTPTEVGVFEIGIEAEGGRLEEAATTALGLVEAMAARGPDAGELSRAKALTTTGWARRMESMDGRATALCEAEALGDVRLVDQLYARALAVTVAEVREAASRWLDRASACAVCYVPRDAADLVVVPAWPPPAGAVDVTVMPDTTRRPARRSRSDDAERHTLPDRLEHWAFPGVDLLVRPKRGAGSVSVLLHFPGAPLGETDASAGLSWLLARTALRGAAGVTGDALAQAAESLGGALTPSVQSDTMGWHATVAPEGLEAVAGLLHDLAYAPDLDAGQLGVERELQASDARRQRDDMFRHPLQRVLALAFRGHPYGLPGLGEPERVRGFDVAQVAAWARAMSAHRPVVVVAGDVTPEQAVERLRPLTAVPGASVGAVGVPAAPSWTPGSGNEARAKQQTALALAFPAGRYASADRFPLKVAGALLSGLAGRLFDELREKRSLAYTVAAVPWLARWSGAMLCYIATSPEREAEAREAMLAELARLSAEPPSEAELARARNYAAGVIEISAQSAAAVAGSVLDAWVHGEVESWADTPRRLREVTIEDVMRVSEEVFRADRRAEFVVRGGAA